MYSKFFEYTPDGVCSLKEEEFGYSKTCVKRPLSKRSQIGFQDQLSLNAGQKYCRILQREHSAILSTFIKLHLSLRSLFCLFLSGCLGQVLLYLLITPNIETDMPEQQH